MLIVFLPISGAMATAGVFAISFWFRSFDVYNVIGPDLTIVHRGGRSETIHLPSVSSFRPSPHHIELDMGNSHRKNIYLLLLRDPGDAFRKAVINGLRPVHERRLAELNRAAQVFAKSRSSAIACTLCAVLFAFIALGVLMDTAPSTTPAERAVLSGILGSMSLLLFIGGAYLRRVDLVVGEGDLTYVSPMGIMRINLSDVQLVSTRQRRQNHRTVITTTVKTADRRIAFTNDMRDFDLVREYVESAVPESARPISSPEAPLDPWKVRRRRLIVHSILMVLTIAPPLLLRRLAATLYHEQDLLDREAVRTVGIVERRERRGGTIAPYQVNYGFVVDGREYHGANRVLKPFYDEAVRGRQVTVEYMRNDPTVSRLAGSISRARAESAMRTSNGGLAGSAFVAILLAGITVYSRRKEARAGESAGGENAERPGVQEEQDAVSKEQSSLQQHV